MTAADGVVKNLRVALERCVSSKPAVRRKASGDSVPMVVKDLRRLAQWGGTGTIEPKALAELAEAAASLASQVHLRDAREWKQLQESEAFQAVQLRVQRALDDVELQAGSLVGAEQELAETRRHNAAAMDALGALKSALGGRVVPVMQSHGTRGSDA
jgi:hypothetical protein